MSGELPVRAARPLEHGDGGRTIHRRQPSSTATAAARCSHPSPIHPTTPSAWPGPGGFCRRHRGANVLLAEPYDAVVFDGVVESGEIPYVSTAQAALDCLNGNARMPAEGEALLRWMRKNGARWQTGTLARRVG